MKNKHYREMYCDCGTLVRNVGEDTVSVKCWKCVQEDLQRFNENCKKSERL